MRFPTTFWETIRDAKRGRDSACERVSRQYWKPVFRFIRGYGHGEADAEDLTQEIFLRLFTEGVLRKAQQDRGHFRSFVLAVAKNVMREGRKKARAGKRGGGRRLLSLDGPALRSETDATLQAVLKGETFDEQFDKLWLDNLLEQAFEQLRAECEARSSQDHVILKSFIEGKETQQALAERFGRTVGQVKSAVHAGRVHLSEHLKRSIRGYCSSRREYDSEISHLLRYLP